MNPKVNFFFEKESKWQEQYQFLRKIMLSCGLEEELKWGVPCYTFQNNNVLLIHGFKEYCALLFHKGVLLHDEQKVLIQQTANVQAARQMRFVDLASLKAQKNLIKAFVFDAIDLEKNGAKVALKKTEQFEMVEEFKLALSNEPMLKEAFYKLTPGRQRAYLLHFSQAKQSKTRLARIDKYREKILNGLGLED